MERQLANDLLLAVAQQRDRGAFARLYEHYAPQVKRYLMRAGADDDAAEEIAQEVMVTIWRKAESFDPSRASAGTWIFTIARNKRIDRFRRERRPEYDPDDPLLVTAQSAEGDAAVVAEQREQEVARALAELPDGQAEILRGAYFEGRSLREIAEELGLPLGTVKSRVRLAMGRLRGSLDPELL
jgi:RNA polymerase sigma factor (sigma-70 family)